MKTSSAKFKGRILQQFSANVITEVYLLGEGDCVSRPMGSGGCDLMMSPIARLNFPFSLECKNTKKFSSISAIRQSRANAYQNTLPGAVWHPPSTNMDESIIYFNFKEFVKFHKERIHD